MIFHYFLPDNILWPSLCKWECLWHTTVCYWDCLYLKISNTLAYCYGIYIKSIPRSGNLLEIFSKKVWLYLHIFLPNCWSEVLQASMKVWATTDRQLSTILAFPRSNTKLGFFIKFTQNLNKGILKYKVCILFCSHLKGRELDFHVWTTSESVIPCCRAWSSKKSNKYWKTKQFEYWIQTLVAFFLYNHLNC